MDVITSQSWYERLSFLSGAPLWIDDGEHIRCIKDVTDYIHSMQSIGVAEAKIDKSRIKAILAGASVFKGASAFLLDDLEAPVSSLADGSARIEEAETALAESHGKAYVKCGSNYYFKRTLSNNWTLLAILPVNAVSEKIWTVILDIFLFSCIVTVMGFALSFVFSRSVSSRVRRLVSFMEKVDIYTDDYLHEAYDDEITAIEKSFNIKLKTIRELIKEVETEHRRREKANFNMLQEQIQPHFLYNCMDSINWMASRQKAYNAAKMARLLGKFYRLILSKGSQVIPLSDELEHVKIYLEIMQMRMDFHLTTDWDIDGSLLEVMTLKLILQPIVENAVLHGLMKGDDDEGQLLISVSRDGSHIILAVADNGVGMDEKVLADLLKGIETDTSVGFGLRNVNRRLKLYYDDSCGLKIESEPGKGTKVIITILDLVA